MAEESQHKEISVAEFFEKNRHLLGYSNKQKAIITTVKEAVDNSITWSTPVLVKIDGETKHIEIGRLIDSLIEKNQEKEEVERGGKLEKLPLSDDEIKVLSFDSQDYSLGFKEVSKVFRHKVNSDIFRVTLEGGRKVELTDYHSVFTLQDGEIKSTKTSSLSEGDYVIIPQNGWESNSIREINLIEELMSLPKEETEKIGVYGVPDLIEKYREKLEEKVDKQWRIQDFKKCDRLPFNLIRDLEINPLELEKCEIGYRFGRNNIPALISVNKDLAELLGIYLAEGSVAGHRDGYEKVYFSLGRHEKKLIGKVEKLAKRVFEIDPSTVKAHESAVNVTINSKIAGLVFEHVFGMKEKATKKRIPRHTFDFSPELRERFLIGYLSGDDYPTKSAIELLCKDKNISDADVDRFVCSSSSQMASSGLQYLFSSIGIDTTAETREGESREVNGNMVEFKESYTLYVHTNQEGVSRNRLPAKEILASVSNSKLSYNLEGRQTRVKTQHALKLDKRNEVVFKGEGYKIARSDLTALPIKKIEKIDYVREWVYDLSVPGHENFMAGSYPTACHNSLDSAEEERVLPEVLINIEEKGDDRLRFRVIDNATGISKEHIPKVFGKLLYGSKFHRLLQARGQQGVGISAAGLYAQLTTGNPITIHSKKKDGETHMFKVRIDTQENEPEILEDKIVDNFKFDHGTSTEMEIEGKYTHGLHSVPTYLKQTAIMNPFARLVLKEPDGNVIEFPRVVNELPKLPKEIKPHPHGVELGILMRMIKNSNSRTISSFLRNEFTRVGKTSAEKICEKAELNKKDRPSSLNKNQIENMLEAMQNTNLQSPPTDCLSPIGEDLIKEGMKKELNPEFLASVTRSPAVYRGMPFQVEVGIAYGGDIESEGNYDVLRYANKVPLLYKRSACAITKAIRETDWSRYGLSQTGNRPQGPVYILVHMCSVWVPFTSEGKEAVAGYPEITKEMKLALQEAGRKLKRYLSKKRKEEVREKKKRKLESYSKELAPALAKLTVDSKDKILEEIEKLLKSKYEGE